MSDSTNDSARLEPVPEGLGRRTRIAATVFVLGCAAFWVFAFSPWAREIFTAPDQLDDETLVVAIETRCAAARLQLDALPSARSAESPAERASVVTAGTLIFRDMTSDIAALERGSGDDDRLVGLWLDDWEVYLSDRTRHAERLAFEGDVRFLTTEDNGVFVNERMNGFARVNDLDSCETPGDL